MEKHYTVKELKDTFSGGADETLDITKMFEKLKQFSDSITSLFMNNKLFMKLPELPCKDEFNKLFESFIKLPISGINSVKIFDFDGTNIKIMEDTDIMKFIFCVIRVLLPYTKNHTNSQIIHMFEPVQLLDTIFRIFGSLFTFICDAETKFEKAFNVQKGGEPITIGVIIIVCVVLFTLIALTIISAVGITITAAVGILAFTVIIITLIQLAPMLFTIAKTKDDKNLTEISVNYLKEYNFDTSNKSINNLTNKLPELFSSFKDAASVSKSAIESGTSLVSGNVTLPKLDKNQKEVDKSQKGAGIICNYLSQLLKISDSKMNISTIKTFIQNLTPDMFKDNDIILQISKYFIIFFYIFNQNIDKIIAPLKKGFVKIFSPIELIGIADESINKTDKKIKSKGGYSKKYKLIKK